MAAQKSFLLALVCSALAWVDSSALAQSPDDSANERISLRGLERGKASYLANCAACHQPDGKGLPGAFPPLAGSDYLKPPYDKAIEAVIGGLQGQLVVNGVTYNNIMPAMSHLSDEDLAATLSYVVNSWGNPGGEIGSAKVAQVRGARSDQAAGERHPGTKEAEMKYKGAPSAVRPESVSAALNPNSPPISGDELRRATQIFFERCAGCHGVLRKGATGKPLTPDLTLAKGTEYLKALINFGSPAGMPNWGTSGELDAADVDLMARFLQHDPPEPPEFGLPQMRASWKVVYPLSKRPSKPKHRLNRAVLA